MAEPKPDLARLRPLFVLEKLSRRLRSDVLEDGTIISECGFVAKRQVQAIDEIVVIRDELFAAFRNASKDPLTCRLHDPNDALVDATIWINEDGSGVVEIAGKTIRFPFVTLLSSDPDARLAQLDEFLHRYRLSENDAAWLRACVARPDFSTTISGRRALSLNPHPRTLPSALPRKSSIPQARTASRLSMFFPAMIVIGIICYRRWPVRCRLQTISDEN